MKIFAAPLQGYTEAPWRLYHSQIFSGVDNYYMPFISYEKGRLRSHDLRELNSELNGNVPLTVQLMAADGEEFSRLLGIAAERGYVNVNLNMGCPFPPQMARGKGAGLMLNPSSLEDIGAAMHSALAANKELKFSVKCRLGVNRADEWKGIVEILNGMPLEYVAIHGRIAAQKYGGEADLDSFSEFKGSLSHPVVYNGDIVSIEDYKRIIESFPDLYGVMIGRGLLADPSLARAIKGGEAEPTVSDLLRMHDSIFSHYTATLCGDSQILSKIKPFWEYLKDRVDRKACKSIKKATSLEKYRQAVSIVENTGLH